jgi:hypothetical protein
MKSKVVNKEKPEVFVLSEVDSKKSLEPLSRIVVSLEEVPLQVRKEEAGKPLYLLRYE